MQYLLTEEEFQALKAKQVAYDQTESMAKTIRVLREELERVTKELNTYKSRF